MTTRNIFTTITSQGNALFQKPLMPLLHLLGSTRLHSTGFCLFSIINEYHCGHGHYSNTYKSQRYHLYATQTKHNNGGCRSTSASTSSIDISDGLISGIQSVDITLVTQITWNSGQICTKINTWDKVLPPNGKPTKVSKRYVQKRGIRLSRVLQVQEQILQSYLFSGFALPVSQTQQQSEILLENAHAHKCVDIYPWSYLKTQILNKKSNNDGVSHWSTGTCFLYINVYLKKKKPTTQLDRTLLSTKHKWCIVTWLDTNILYSQNLLTYCYLLTIVGFPNFLKIK